ncbi:MAG: PDZ domain-containing protein, partial [Candidatus Electrothrix sp. AR1]|nr:PDZ domain-containing protein [Candidatus Electrothrix sp. AR1]
EIKPDRSGKILCFPYPGSPAERAGIRFGDQLLTVNNTSVDRDSLPTISIMTAGEPGTEVQLAVSSGNGPKKQMAVQREQLSVDDVSTRKKNEFLIIQLRSFRQGTKKKLLGALKKSKDLPIILDLRKNSGGNLAAAISSAAMFLKKEEVVVRIQKRKGRNAMTSSTDMVGTTESIYYIWQDAFTASSAEVFIAALTENDKAVSIGRRTFGKGTMQDVFTLHDNSALILTTGRLLTPNNFDFDGLGLPPDINLLSNNLTTEDYLMKTKELLTP